MFQDAALFPWLSVARNVELALRLRGVAKAAPSARAAELLRLVRLDGFAAKRPHELSGGMRQRVALARALAQDRQHPADGRALRRPRRHDPRPAPRGAGAGVAGGRSHRACSSPTTSARRSAWPTGSCCCPAGPGRIVETYAVSIPRPRRIDSPEVAALAGDHHRPAAGGGGPPWRSLTGSTGSWRGSTSSSWACPGSPSRARRIWSATWPKLAAIAIGLALWQLVVWSGWKPTYLLPGPATVFHHLWEDRHAGPERGRRPPCAGRSSTTPSPWSSARWWRSPSPGSGPFGWR